MGTAGTASVLAVVVCHDEDERLPDVFAALRRLAVRPRRAIAVRTGGSEGELAEAADLFDEVLTLPSGDLAASVSAALDHASQRWEDSGDWVWVLRGDSAPDADCLEELVRVGADEPEAVALGPLALDRADPRLVLDAGLSMDALGRRQTGVGRFDVDPALGGPGPRTVTEVLAVSSAGALIRRKALERLGFGQGDVDAEIDLGWRINAEGGSVLRVPSARVRHSGSAGIGGRARVRGVRTFLINTSPASFVLGVPRLSIALLLRFLGFVLLRRRAEAGAEFAVFWRLLFGRLGLREDRAVRYAATPHRRSVRDLLTSRRTRLNNRVRGAFAALVRGRVERDVLLGRSHAAVEPTERPLAGDGEHQRPTGGLRAWGPIGVPVVAQPKKPTPARRSDDLLLVPVDRALALRELLLAPPLVLAAALALVTLLLNGFLAEVPRLSADVAGGRLLPVADLGRTWSDYLDSWHPVGGGTASPAPPSLLVLTVLGLPLAPFGGPALAMALLVLGGPVLAGLSAYGATRGLAVSRWGRALAAGVYALLPAATMSAAQGRVDVVVAHVLVPPLLAGLAAVIGLTRLTPLARSRNWLQTAGLTTLGLAVIGAFAPLMHVLLVALALLGFVSVPGEARRAPRRVAGVATVVLLPVACLLPWPIVLLRNPEILLHGLGARSTEPEGGLWLLALSPEGSPASWAGLLLVVGAVAALLTRPTRSALPGVVVAVVGASAAVLVSAVSVVPITGGPSTPGWAGGPLLLAAAGLMWILLVTPRPRWAAAPVLAGVLLIVTVSGLLAGRTGPLAPPQAVPVDGALLTVERPDVPARLSAGAPRFGDDDFVPVGSGVTWLRKVNDDLLSGDRERVRSALAAAAARGVRVVEAPRTARLEELAGGLLGDSRLLPGGAELLRVLVPGGGVELLGPDLARQAEAGAWPSPQARPVPVPASPPHVAVRVSEGGVGRMLVLGAENEAGWRAWIDGRPAPLASAWGNQVAVPLPEHASEVRVSYTEVPRTTLLVLQTAAILFVLIAALPERRRRNP